MIQLSDESKAILNEAREVWFEKMAEKMYEDLQKQMDIFWSLEEPKEKTFEGFLKYLEK